jgi:hypothetical protein
MAMYGVCNGIRQAIARRSSFATQTSIPRGQEAPIALVSVPKRDDDPVRPVPWFQWISLPLKTHGPTN